MKKKEMAKKKKKKYWKKSTLSYFYISLLFCLLHFPVVPVTLVGAVVVLS